jgi:hypothetical protein
MPSLLTLAQAAPTPPCPEVPSLLTLTSGALEIMLGIVPVARLAAQKVDNAKLWPPCPHVGSVMKCL